MRKQNEKMAKAIRRVKDNPELVHEVAGADYNAMLESQIKSQELDKLKDDIVKDHQRLHDQESESKQIDQELSNIN